MKVLNLTDEITAYLGSTDKGVLANLVKKLDQSDMAKKCAFLLKCELARSPSKRFDLADLCIEDMGGDILARTLAGKLTFIKTSGCYYTERGVISAQEVLKRCLYVQFECHEEEAWALGRTIVNVQGARTISRLFPIVRVPSFNYEIPPRVGKTADDYVIHSSLLKGG